MSGHQPFIHKSTYAHTSNCQIYLSPIKLTLMQITKPKKL